jgi:hypothetical protein
MESQNYMNIEGELIFTDVKYKKSITLILGNGKGCCAVKGRNARAGMKQLRHIDREVCTEKEILDFPYCKQEGSSGSEYTVAVMLQVI